MSGLLYDFRGHPKGRPNEGLREGVIVEEVIFGVKILEYLLACPEVWQLDNPIIVDQDICTFKVSVNNAILVKISEPL